MGLKLQAMKLLAPITEKVKIAQKTIKYGPLDKLQDALITILAGAHGLSEINTRLRADPALQQAFGRAAYAEGVRGAGYTQCLHSDQCCADDAGVRSHLAAAQSRLPA